MQVNTNIDRSFGRQLREIASTLGSLQPTTDANLYGIINHVIPARRSNYGERDYVLSLRIIDPTGEIFISIFNKDRNGLPQVDERSIGDAFVAKHMVVGRFPWGLQAKSKKTGSEFAPVSMSEPNGIESEPSLNETDVRIITILKMWNNERVPIPNPTVRPMMQLQPQPEQLNPTSSGMEVDDIETVVHGIDLYAPFDTLIHAKHGTQYYTLAAIVAYKPENVEDWRTKFCPACSMILLITVTNCSNCGSPNLENILKFLIKIEDIDDKQLIVHCFGENIADLFPGVDMNNIDDTAMVTIKQYMEGAKSSTGDKKYLRLGLQIGKADNRKAFKLIKTQFV